MKNTANFIGRLRFVIITLALGLSLGAQANDGAVPYIEVRGIDTAQNTMESSISVYGGEIKKFFDVLPFDFVMTEESRSVQFFSPSYTGVISCSKQYTRPTNGELREDYHCRFGFADWTLEDVFESGGDSYNVAESSEEPFTLPESTHMDVLGISSEGIQLTKTEKLLFSFYGGQAEYFGLSLDGQDLQFESAAYSVRMTCSQSYTHPWLKDSNGAPVKLNDYMCSVLAKKN